MDAAATVASIQTIKAALKVLTALQLTAFLWPEQAHVQDGASFDFIIVGAGSAGSVIANRLTEIDDVTVLLIEAGGDPPIESVIPALSTYMKNTSNDWGYKTEDDGYSQQFHKNHGPELTRGKMLGGSSSLNFLAYTRGNYHDFNNWAYLTGDDSWSWKNVLPYFIKSERMVDPVILNSEARKFHGVDGYLGVTRYYNEEALNYFQAFEELGHRIVLDINGDTPLGYTERMYNIADGVRQSSAQSFLHPIKDRPNLFVLKKTLVQKIIFDNFKNAVGVEVSIENNSTMKFKAKREVIVSAGAINSPQLLMLSGIGPKEHLEKQNIEVISDLPVGQALQDHVMVMIVQTMGNSTPSKPANPGKISEPTILGYVTLNHSQKYPDYESISFVMNEPSPMLPYCSFYFSYLDEICQSLYDGSTGKTILFSLIFLLNPKSHGKILLRSKNPKEKPMIYTGYYSNSEDLENHAKYLNDFSKVHNTQYFRSVKSKLVAPEACGCRDPDSTHEYWKCYALCMMVSGYHYASSCPMGHVVDSRLNVLGVKRLRIADASVMPKIVRAHINAATIMIGEKAADMIKKDHHLHLNHSPNNSTFTTQLRGTFTQCINAVNKLLKYAFHY